MMFYICILSFNSIVVLIFYINILFCFLRIVVFKQHFFFNFFFNFFKLPQFIFFFKNINYGNFKKGILFKYNNVFLSYKFFICADVGDSVLYKKGLSLQFRQFNNFFFLFSELFIKREYAKYLNCFYLLFFNKIPFLFFSLQDFFLNLQIFFYIFMIIRFIICTNHFFCLLEIK